MNIYLNKEKSYVFENNRRIEFDIDNQDIVKGLDSRNLDMLVDQYNLTTTQSKDFTIVVNKIRYRAHIYHSQSGWNLALRELPSSMMDWQTLGVDKEEVMSICRGSGLTLFCGVTNSGKSTTMQRCINSLEFEHILGHTITIEDPIEYLFDEIPSVIQREIGSDVASFEQGLIDAVRATPKTIMIGEIRDIQTALEATKAGLSGHRVLATIHANDIKMVISRMQSFLGEKHKVLLTHAIQGIMAQNLVMLKDGMGRSNLHCIYETMYFDAGAKTVLLHALDDNSGGTLNGLIHQQERQKRQTIKQKKQMLLKQGADEYLLYTL